MSRVVSYILTVVVVLATVLGASAHRVSEGEGGPAILNVDTLVSVDAVTVSSVKQTLDLREEPLSATVLDAKRIDREGVKGIKDVVTSAPNFFMPDYGSRMTSSIYVRGLGTRIDQPVVGMTVDNVPIADKNMYDTSLPDIERIEILRGPQSTLYGRNTMCGVVNIYTLSPLKYQGIRVNADYGSRNSYRIGASVYNKPLDNFGISVAAQFAHCDGYFRNTYDGSLCDKENGGDVRMKLQYRHGALAIDNVLSLTTLRQGGYPYAYAGSVSGEEQHVDLLNKICYNDESSYSRLGISDGLTIRYDWRKLSLTSITSYQFLDDDMHLDQDFLPLSYFTLQQKRRQHDVTEDLVVRSKSTSRYQWMCGVFGFYKSQQMSAPVDFLPDGIDRLILANVNKHSGYDGVYRWGLADGTGGDHLWLGSDFTTHTLGWALYHQSSLRAGAWLFTLGLRLDGETAQMLYHNSVNSAYTAFPSNTDRPPHEVVMKINDSDVLTKTFIEFLPRLAISVDLGAAKRNKLYLSVSKGYKAGGFNTQMFSEVLQRRVQDFMGMSADLDVENIITYKPEKSWNFELGGHFSTRDARFTADFALFHIECFDQQLTVFPEGQTTGRMMTNAGRTRSFGVETSFAVLLHEHLTLNGSYGYTNARFREFVDGENDYAGNRIPYAPEHTLSARLTYEFPLTLRWMERIVVALGCSAAGPIYWNEDNTLRQPFYALADGSVRFEHKRWGLDLWVRNATATPYSVFYFESMGNRFLQRGKPRSYGARVSLNF